MAAYKDEERGTWYVQFYYKDWQGNMKRKTKRGFYKKKDALDYERAFKQKQSNNLDMLFKDFVDVYKSDCLNRLKRNTLMTKEYIIQEKIVPYFGKKRIQEIVPADIIAWQNELLAYKDEKGKPYSTCYLKTIHNQLSAIFNHAVRYYQLKDNPARKAGNMGKEKTKEMNFWTKDEYMRFSNAVMDKDIVYHAFEVLYWCGIRLGELLALTVEDFDFDKGTLTINKSLQRHHGENEITSPKTEKSNRTIQMPDFLVQEMKDFISRNYGMEKDDRVFQISKNALHREMTRGSNLAGVKRIRIHDLRHSHVSLLIDMGLSAVAVANRVGHESIDITYRYAHLFPTQEKEIANKLNFEREESNHEN